MNQKGFSSLIIVLGIILVVGIVGGAYYFGTLKNSKTQTKNQVALSPTSQPTSPPIPSPVDETANWKTYTNSQYNFSLKYPSDWSTKVTSDHPAALIDLAFYATSDTGIWGGLFNGAHIEIYNYNQELALTDYVNQQIIKPYISYEKSVDPTYSEDRIKTLQLTVDSLPALQISGLGAPQDSSELAKIITPSERGPYIFGLKNDKLFVWHWQGNPDSVQFAQELQTFSTILSTFKFTQ